MAMIPLKQTVTRYRTTVVDNDGWGTEETTEQLTLYCRAEESVEIVINNLGEEVRTSVTLLFDKLPDIRYTDEIEYTNELGVTIKRNPQRISPIRMINGKPTLTRVYL